MLRVDCARWNQCPADLRQLAMEAEHRRSRERFLVLYEISQGHCTTQVARQGRRDPQTVMRWVHTYNQHGPQAMLYRRTGGRPPFVRSLKGN